MPEFSTNNYFKLMEQREVTPNRIQKFLDHSDDDFTAEDVWRIMPPEIVSIFMSNSGRLKEKHLKKFMKSLDLLLQDYKPMDLIKMDTDCVNHNGSINETNLRRILTEGTGI